MNGSVALISDEVDKLIHRLRLEYDVSYADVIAVLQMKIFLLCREASERSDEV